MKCPICKTEFDYRFEKTKFDAFKQKVVDQLREKNVDANSWNWEGEVLCPECGMELTKVDIEQTEGDSR